MSRLFAAIYDPIIAQAERACLQAWRASLLSPLEGAVLEIGAGTGANLPHYSAKVSRLVLSEPDAHMRRRLSARAAQAQPGAELCDRSVMELPYEDQSFDAVVSTLVLCSVPSLSGALVEARRVLRPGGQLVFLEHVLDPRPGRARLQRALCPVWRRVAGGCRLTRRTEEAIGAAGFELQAITRESMRRSVAPVRHTIRGVAVRP